MAIPFHAATTLTDRIIQQTAVKHIASTVHPSQPAMESRLTDTLRTGHSDVWQHPLDTARWVSTASVYNKQLVA